MLYMMSCVRCGSGWLDEPGLLGKHHPGGCPKCRSLYWRWNITDAQIQALDEKDEERHDN